MEKHYLSPTLETNSFHQSFHGEDWCFEGAFLEQSLKVEKILKEKNGNTYVLSGVHKAVYSLGNSLKKDAIFSEDNFVQTDRGGKVMYHGPGQITFYPILKIKDFFKGPRDYTNFLFQTAIKFFKEEHGVVLVCKNNGLWNSENKKVGFVGLRIRGGVTYHGLSLNYFTDLNAFLKHSPCDISGDQAGNIFADEKFSPALKQEALKLSAALVSGLTILKA